jgi:hypothetical protein
MTRHSATSFYIGKDHADTGDVVRKRGICLTACQDHPYGMVAGALGIGFVLGGGISVPLATRLAGLGLRIGWIAAVAVLKREVAQLFNVSKSQPQRNER